MACRVRCSRASHVCSPPVSNSRCLNVWFIRSTAPFVCGWYEGDVKFSPCRIPKFSQNPDICENSEPLSVRIVFGMIGLPKTILSTQERIVSGAFEVKGSA